MKSLSAVAQKYIGAKEWSNGHRQIIQGYNKISPLPRGYKVQLSDNWCATFVSYIIKECGYNGPYECSANRLREKMRYKVKTGDVDDVIFYDWNGDKWSDHVGIIYDVKGNYYEVIEGNYRNSVGVRTIRKDSKNIQGIYRLTEKTNDVKKRITKRVIADVIAGKYGNGQERKEKLKKAGYDPDKVQEAVNKMI